MLSYLGTARLKDKLPDKDIALIEAEARKAVLLAQNLFFANGRLSKNAENLKMDFKRDNPRVHSRGSRYYVGGAASLQIGYYRIEMSLDPEFNIRDPEHRVELSSTINHELYHAKRREYDPDWNQFQFGELFSDEYAIEEGMARAFELETGHPVRRGDLEACDFETLAPLFLAADPDERFEKFEAFSRKLHAEQASARGGESKNSVEDDAILEDDQGKGYETFGLAVVAGYLRYTNKTVSEIWCVPRETILNHWRNGDFPLITTEEELLLACRKPQKTGLSNEPVAAL